MMTHKIVLHARYHVSMRRLTVLITLIVLSVTISPTNAQALAGGFYDDKNPLLMYSGAWVEVVDSSLYMGSRRTTGNTTSNNFFLSFDFFGNGFTIYVLKGGTAGQINMCVNNVCSIVDLYSPVLVWAELEVTGVG